MLTSGLSGELSKRDATVPGFLVRDSAPRHRGMLYGVYTTGSLAASHAAKGAGV